MEVETIKMAIRRKYVGRRMWDELTVPREGGGQMRTMVFARVCKALLKVFYSFSEDMGHFRFQKPVLGLLVVFVATQIRGSDDKVEKSS